MNDFPDASELVTSLVKVIAEKDKELVRLHSLLRIRCNHEFSTQSMRAYCHHCGIVRAAVPQHLVTPRG